MSRPKTTKKFEKLFPKMRKNLPEMNEKKSSTKSSKTRWCIYKGLLRYYRFISKYRALESPYLVWIPLVISNIILVIFLII